MGVLLGNSVSCCELGLLRDRHRGWDPAAPARAARSTARHGRPAHPHGPAPSGVDAFIDTYGDGYVELALALGVAAKRIDTIVDFAVAAKHGVKTDDSGFTGGYDKASCRITGIQ